MTLQNKDITTGRDCTLQLNGPNGVIAFARLTEWDVKVQYFSPESTAIDGVTRRQSDIKGYDVSFSLERTSNFTDQYLAAQQANFLIDGTQLYLSATETIQEKSGNVSQYIYENVDLQIPDLGNRKVGEFTIIKGSFFASIRTPSPSNSSN